MEKISVYQSNKITSANYAFTLGEQRLMFMAISKSSRDEPLPKTHRISAKDFAERYSISDNEAYEQLKRAAKTIFEKEISYTTSNKEKIKQRWITRQVIYKSGDIEFSIAPEVISELESLRKEYTKYKHEKIVGMTSPYSIRIFTMMMQFKSTGWLEISIDELRARLGLGKKYRQYGVFKLRIITPSLKQIKDLADYETQVKEFKKGRKVVKLRLTFIENVQPKLI